jgi:dihydrofolate reductase
MWAMGIVYTDLAISMDGYIAGPDQSMENPLGVDGPLLHQWKFRHLDDNRAEASATVAAGAFILGRNMFGPDRGEWDLDWQGWWGPEPPYHGPVFVLGHNPREPLQMEGGTSFTFVTEGITRALELARSAAGDADISIGGGAETVRQYLAADLVDEIRLHIAPLMLGGGERPFDDLPRMDFEPVSVRAAPTVTHVTWRRTR